LKSQLESSIQASHDELNRAEEQLYVTQRAYETNGSQIRETESLISRIEALSIGGDSGQNIGANLGFQALDIFRQDPQAASEAAQLGTARETLSRLVAESSTLNEQLEKAGGDVNRLREEQERLQGLSRDVRPCLDSVDNLAFHVDSFKTVLSLVKSKTAALAEDAAEVAGSDIAASSQSDDKATLAGRIIKLCNSALFDVQVKGKIETIATDIERGWTVDGELTLEEQLKTQLQRLKGFSAEYLSDEAYESWRAGKLDLDSHIDENKQGVDSDETDDDEEADEAQVEDEDQSGDD